MKLRVLRRKLLIGRTMAGGHNAVIPYGRSRPTTEGKLAGSWTPAKIIFDATPTDSM